MMASSAHEPQESSSNPQHLIQSTSEFKEIAALRDQAAKHHAVVPNKKRHISSRYDILKIVVWKNMIIKRRRKTQFLLLLLQIFIWFGIACFSLATRSSRLEYYAEPFGHYTHLVPRLNPSNFEYPIAINYNRLSVWREGRDQENLFQDTFQNIMKSWTHYIKKTYQNHSFKFKLFSDKQTMLSTMKDDKRYPFGISIDWIDPNMRQFNYSLHFWEKEVPVNDEFFSFDCRVPKSGWTWGVCQMGLYGRSGFLLSQMAMNDAIMRVSLQHHSRSTKNEDSLKTDQLSDDSNEVNENAENGVQTTSEKTLSFSRPAQFTHAEEEIPNRFRLELPGVTMIAERSPEHESVRSAAAESAGSAPFYFMFALISVFSYTVMDMVHEKETKMKEIMKTYGLSSGMFWLSSLITWATLNFFTTWLATFIVTISGVFGKLTSNFILFGLIYLYLLSLMAMGFIVSVFFQKSQTATIAGMIFNLVLYGLGWLVHHTRLAQSWVRVIKNNLFCNTCDLFQFMLFSTVTFSLSITDLIEMLPDGGVPMYNLFNFYEHDIDEVVSRDWGSTKHWTFIFGYAVNKIKYVLGYKTFQQILKEKEEDPLLSTNLADPRMNLDWVEKVPIALKQSGTALKIRDLVKRFPAKEGGYKTVVDKLNLEMYPSEIFGLLGHNGAGKTTTISMLTGMLQIDDGDATIMGYSIKKYGETARKLISVCPQQNFFFEDLTCLEHLVFFAALRGIDVTQGLEHVADQKFFNDLIIQKRFLVQQRGKIVDAIAQLSGNTTQMQREGIIEMESHFNKFGLSLFTDPPTINYVHESGRTFIKADTWPGILAAIEKVGLSEKMFAIPAMLSGGMKRRFWLVIALIGDPKVVFLDEPTSGVDPLGRQELWRLIQDEKIAGRCIVMTTHHMEEADILADRKAIMTAGKLRCVGSSLFLKSKFGIGYFLEIEVTNKVNREVAGQKILQFIHEYVPEAISQTENRKGSAATMAAARKSVLLYSLPLSSVSKFAKLFHDLEARKQEFHILQYGVSLSTLEEIFFALGDEEIERQLATEEAASLAKDPPPPNSMDVVASCHRRDSLFAMDSSVEPQGKRASLMSPTKEKTKPLMFGKRGDLVSQKFQGNLRASSWKYIYAVVTLRGLQIAHNKLNFFIDIIFPVFTLIVSFFFRPEGPGGLGSLMQKPDTIISMNQFEFFNKTIPIAFDPDLTNTTLQSSFNIIREFPDEIKKLLQVVGVGDPKTESEEALEGLIEAGLSYEASKPLLTGVRIPVFESPPAGRVLRNYFWTMKDKSIYPKPALIPCGLNFEPRSENLYSMDHVIEAEKLQIRIIWDGGVPHGLPMIFTAISNAVAQANMIQLVSGNEQQTHHSGGAHQTKPSFHIQTNSWPLMLSNPTYVTTMTYGMYVMLSLGLSSLPSRFGIQIMLDKFIGTKHAMIVMGLPFTLYWTGSFIMNYLAMLLGNLIVCVFIAYFIPLFWSFAIVPVIACTFFTSASVLLWSYFLSQLFGNLKAYAMTLQFSSMILSLCPAYIVSVFADAAMSGARWGNSMLITHIICAVLFPPYNPIGVLIGCAIVTAEAYHAEVQPTLYDHFNILKLPVWSVIAAALQAAVLFWATVAIDRRHYQGKRPPASAPQLLEMLYTRREQKRNEWLLRRNGNENLIPASLQNHKDEDVLAEEFEALKMEKVLIGQTQLYKNAKTEQEKTKLSQKFQQTAKDDLSFPDELPLVVINDLHYLFEPRSAYDYPNAAVRGFSLNLYRGEIFGLLGPNGAGKTTSINLLTCNYIIEAPTKGTAYLGGHDVSADPSAAFTHLGLCPQFDALFTDITVKDNLRTFGRIKNIPEKQLDSVVESYIIDLELEAHQNKRIMECSGGNKRRVSIATAFMGSPDVVLMDEPSSGIDPIGRRKLAEMIHRESEKRCVLITTHSMEEAEALCSRIGIIVNGELNCLNTSLQIRNRYGAGVRLEIIFDESSPNYVAFDPSGKSKNPWQQFVLSEISSESIETGKVANRLTYDIPLGSDSLGRLFDLLENNKSTFAILEYGLSQPTLEQVFITFAKRQKSAQESMQEIFR